MQGREIEDIHKAERRANINRSKHTHKKKRKKIQTSDDVQGKARTQDLWLNLHPHSPSSSCYLNNFSVSLAVLLKDEGPFNHHPLSFCASPNCKTKPTTNGDHFKAASLCLCHHCFPPVDSVT